MSVGTEEIIAGLNPSEEATFAAVVVRREVLATGVIGLTLARRDGRQFPSWSAGAHIDLLLGEGLVRQYSLCGDPEDRTTVQVAVLREENGRGGSAHVHDEVVTGRVLDVGGPRNHFELVDAVEYLFLAGGIGVTPILPMILTAVRRGRPWRLVYGGRSRESMAFAGQLQERYAGLVTVLPQDETGLLPLAEIVSGVADGAAVYCCGPEALLAATEAECERQSVVSLRVERFSAKPVTTDVPDHAFEVELANSGLTLSVGADTSILDAVEEAGVAVDSSCRDGTCGSCETGVLEGRPDHRDSVLSPAEREASATMFLCVSRCLRGRLVLDL